MRGPSQALMAAGGTDIRATSTPPANIGNGGGPRVSRALPFPTRDGGGGTVGCGGLRALGASIMKLCGTSSSDSDSSCILSS